MDVTQAFIKRRQIKEFKQDVFPEKSLINSLLEKTYELVPSKQNLMPYQILILGPDKKKDKKILFDLAEGDYTRVTHLLAPYVLIYTSRLSFPNDSVLKKMDRGVLANQSCDPTAYHLGEAQADQSLEVGMHSTILSALCIEEGIDVSFIKCFPRWGGSGQLTIEKEMWSKLEYVKDPPLMIVCLGYHKYIPDKKEYEDKPDFDEINLWI